MMVSLFELKLFEQGDDSEKEMVRIDELFAADFSIGYIWH